MGLFGGFSIFSVVSLMLTAVGFIVQLIGYSAPYWIKMGNENAGLWKTCAGGLCEDFVGSIHVDKPGLYSCFTSCLLKNKSCYQLYL